LIKPSFPWPANTPDLNPLDFNLWGFVKHEVFAANPQSIEETKEMVRNILAAIPQATLQRTIGNFERRLDLCNECALRPVGGTLKRRKSVSDQ